MEVAPAVLFEPDRGRRRDPARPARSSTMSRYSPPRGDERASDNVMTITAETFREQFSTYSLLLHSETFIVFRRPFAVCLPVFSVFLFVCFVYGLTSDYTVIIAPGQIAAPKLPFLGSIGTQYTVFGPPSPHPNGTPIGSAVFGRLTV